MNFRQFYIHFICKFTYKIEIWIVLIPCENIPIPHNISRVHVIFGIWVQLYPICKSRIILVSVKFELNHRSDDRTSPPHTRFSSILKSITKLHKLTISGPLTDSTCLNDHFLPVHT